MDDYIKRKDMHKALDSHYFTGKLSLKETIDSVPAADVVARDCYDRLLAENDELRKVRPMVRGKWSFDNIIFTDADGASRSGMRGYKCSECDGFCIGESNYCPNCGADMRRSNE